MTSTKFVDVLQRLQCVQNYVANILLQLAVLDSPV